VSPFAIFATEDSKEWWSIPACPEPGESVSGVIRLRQICAPSEPSPTVCLQVSKSGRRTVSAI
jgi:hypothetical protein